MSREAMELALDMLNEIADDVYCDQKLEGVIAALRQALETEQKPVAWISEGGDVSRTRFAALVDAAARAEENEELRRGLARMTALYEKAANDRDALFEKYVASAIRARSEK